MKLQEVFFADVEIGERFKVVLDLPTIRTEGWTKTDASHCRIIGRSGPIGPDLWMEADEILWVKR